jgi:predicted ATPase/DNA-binding SARP family transcriptional activator/TolA-binding protein
VDRPWRIELLGELCARRDEREIRRFATGKTSALLAYLAYYRGRDQAREVLIDRFWPDADHEAGQVSLRVALNSLRKQLEPPEVPRNAVLFADRSHVRLNPAAVVTDVAEFEVALKAADRAATSQERLACLTQAIELYRGELLPGYYDEWALTERERLNDIYIGALHRLTDALTQENDVENAIAYAHRALAADALREELHLTLMRLYVASDRPAEALEQYRRLESLLREQVRATPSPEARALAQMLLDATQKPAPARRAVPVRKPDMAAQSPRIPSPSHAEPPSPRLPLQFTRFYGREEELAYLHTLLMSPNVPRLTTLIGLGGIGKTRAAIEAARAAAAAFDGNACFVSLADLTDASLIPEAIARALSLPLMPDRDPLEQVLAVLRSPTLLVLDNMEQLLGEEESDRPDGAQMVQTLLSRAPDLVCLVTSRHRLGLPGERVIALTTLPTPPDAEAIAPEEALRYVGVQLFVDRAQEVRPDFQITPRNVPAVAALCARLEGMPLALELAAAWAQALTPAQMLERLEARFALLVARGRSSSARHHSLRACIEWSFHLLSPELQRVLVQMSMFHGGWTLEAAEAVCDYRVLESLARLQERSLIVTEENGDTMRYRMLETVREFAGEQGTQADRDALAARHAHCFLRLAEESETGLTGPEQRAWLERLNTEQENLRAALAWALEQSPEIALRLCAAMALCWQWSGRGIEGRDWLRRALAQAEACSLEVRVRALLGAGRLALISGDFSEADRLMQECLPLCDAPAQQIQRATALFMLGVACLELGDNSAARTLFEASLILRRESGDIPGSTYALANLGEVASREGDLATARRYWEEAAALFRTQGNLFYLEVILSHLGTLALEQGVLERAEALEQEANGIRRQLGKPTTSEFLSGAIALERGALTEAQAYFLETLQRFQESHGKLGYSSAMFCLGDVCLLRGERAAARRWYEESLAVAQEIGSQDNSLRTLLRLGAAALMEGALEQADGWLRECLAMHRKLLSPVYAFTLLTCIAALRAAQGRHPEAARLLGTAEHLRENLGIVLPPPFRGTSQQAIATVREALGEERFVTLWQEGAETEVEQALTAAFGVVESL